MIAAQLCPFNSGDFKDWESQLFGCKLIEQRRLQGPMQQMGAASDPLVDVCNKKIGRYTGAAGLGGRYTRSLPFL